MPRPFRTEMISTVSQLEAVDRFMEDIGRFLIMEPGSIARVVWHSLSNWKVDINEKTRGWLMQKSAESYLEEWKSSDWRNNDIISKATVAIGLDDGNEYLNDATATMLVDMLLYQYKNGTKKNIKICDIGAGTGNTTKAILNRLWNIDEDLAKKVVDVCTFYLIELSPARVSDIDAGVNNHVLKPDCKILVASDSDMLPLMVGGTFDFVVSGAVFHHNSFPDYLAGIHRLLGDDGVLIFGDWHMSICERPEYIVPLIRMLVRDDAPHDLVMDFMCEFGVDSENVILFPDGTTSLERMCLPQEERVANVLNRNFIREIGRQREEMKGFAGVVPRMFFLEALETIDKKKKQLDEAGFVTDFSELAAIRPEFKRLRHRTNVVGVYPPAPNIACSIAVAKADQFYHRLRVPERTTSSWSPAPVHPHPQRNGGR